MFSLVYLLFFHFLSQWDVVLVASRRREVQSEASGSFWSVQVGDCGDGFGPSNWLCWGLSG